MKYTLSSSAQKSKKNNHSSLNYNPPKDTYLTNSFDKMKVTPYDASIEKMNSSLESTFYKTNRDHKASTERGYRSDARSNDRGNEKEDVIIENLKYFVNNSPSINKVQAEEEYRSPRVTFSSKDYLKKDNYILNSIFNEDNFVNSQKKKKCLRSNSSTNFFNYNKTKYLVDNGKLFFCKFYFRIF